MLHSDEVVQYTLRAISLQKARTYLVELVTKDGQTLETTCKVVRVESNSIPPFELVQFLSDDFNRLCTSGRVYVKPIGAAVLAFHACIPGMD